VMQRLLPGASFSLSVSAEPIAQRACCLLDVTLV
jgi:hypothetical protein